MTRANTVTNVQLTADMLFDRAVLAQLHLEYIETGESDHMPGDETIWKMQRDGDILARLMLRKGVPNRTDIRNELDEVQRIAQAVLDEHTDPGSLGVVGAQRYADEHADFDPDVVNYDAAIETQIKQCDPEQRLAVERFKQAAKLTWPGDHKQYMALLWENAQVSRDECDTCLTDPAQRATHWPAAGCPSQVTGQPIRFHCIDDTCRRYYVEIQRHHVQAQ